MKNVLLFFTIISLLPACQNKKNNGLAGQYKLIEILIDPGTGQGTFQPVTSDKIIHLFEDGTITSNGEICQLGAQSDNPTSGTYSQIDSVIKPDNCKELRFETNGKELIIDYPCIEPCRAKFLKQ